MYFNHMLHLSPCLWISGQWSYDNGNKAVETSKNIWKLPKPAALTEHIALRDDDMM